VIAARTTAALCLCLAMPAAGCAGSEHGTQPDVDQVTAAVVPYLTLMPFYIAAEEGYFAEQNLDVEFVRLGRDTELMTALARGQVDVAGGMLTANELSLIAGGAHIRMVASLGDLDPDACSYAALVARREALESGALQDPEGIRRLRFDANVILPFGYFIDELLRPYDLTTEDLDVIDLPSPAALAAIADGSIDVTIDSEPFLSQYLASGDTAIWARIEQIVPDYTFAALRYGPTILDGRPEVGERFAVAMLQAIRQFNRGKTARNLDIVQRASGLSPERVAASCWPVTDDDAHVDAAIFRGYQEWNVSRGFTDRVLPDGELVDHRFFDHASAVLGPPAAGR
jgi:NitT/TauT family transport system substrate-binding protein